MRNILLTFIFTLACTACTTSRNPASKTTETAGANKEKIKVDKDGIRKTFFDNQRSIRKCYESELEKNPDLAGKVKLKFDIEKDGKVKEVSIQESTLKNKGVHTCLMSQVKSFQFPKPLNGQVVNVIYPLGFASK